MLLFDSIREKPLKSVDEGVDISYPVTWFDGYVRIERTVLVTDDMRMRPSLIAQVAMGDQNKADYLMKFNGVDNPFSVDAGDYLAVPPVEDCRPRKSPFVAPADIRQEIASPSRAGKADQKRLEFLSKMAASEAAGTREVLPPNFAPSGSQEMRESNGIVTFGPDVTSGNDAACEPKSRAELKAKLLQKKIFRDR